MAPSIFLTNAPYSLKERYGKLSPIGSNLPSLGLLMLAASLKKAGNKVRVIDASAQNLRYERVIQEIKKFKPDLIGISAVTPSIVKTAKLAKMIKNIYPSIPIVIGGAHFTALPEKTLLDFPYFDYGIIGEGEETIVELVETLSANRNPLEVDGVAFCKDGKIYLGQKRDVIENLDSLPFPAWELLEGFPYRYNPAIFKYKKLPSTHIVSARGCPNKCIFCDNSVFGNSIRFHSAEYVVEMVKYLVKNFKIKDIIFEDDQFLINKERIEKICTGFLKYKLNISWSCSGRVNSINDISLLKLMKKSGCWLINYGIESGNQKILDFAKKSITLSQIEKAVQLTHKVGILSKGYFIFGFPGETEKTMKNTIKFAKKLPLSDISIFMLTPFPGSEIYNIAKNYGEIEENFEKMNILNVVYVPKGLSKKILIKYQKQFVIKFYFRIYIIINYFKRFLINPKNVFRILKSLLFF